MDRFAIRPSYRIEHRSKGTRLSVRTLPSDEPVEETIELLRANLPKELKLFSVIPGWGDLVVPPPHEPFAAELPEDPVDLVDREMHWRRIAEMQARLKAFGVTGVSELDAVPAGWVSVLEAVVDGWVELLDIEAEGKIGISQIKEKFGTLRIHAHPVGSAEFMDRVEHISDWGEAAATGRCMITGHPGYYDQAGWVLTLCPRAMAWRRMFPQVFKDVIYPRKLQGERAN